MRLWGHPIHPVLVHFPVAFWTVAAAAYVAGAAGMGEAAAAIAKFSNGSGLIMAIFAMAAGLLELRAIDSRSDAMRVATWHMMVMATAWVCFLLALVLPISAGAAMDQSTAQLVGVLSAATGFLLMSVGGWLGGRLVYEFGIGVKSRARS
jgi:uncharacterized membrane protein